MRKSWPSAEYPWASDLPSLRFHFFAFKMGIQIPRCGDDDRDEVVWPSVNGGDIHHCSFPPTLPSQVGFPEAAPKRRECGGHGAVGLGRESVSERTDTQERV